MTLETRVVPEWLLPLLRCAGCGAVMVPSPGALRCASCARAYPVRDGIVQLLPAEPAADPWEESASGIARYLAAHPDVARRFATAPPVELAPADRLLQALIAEDAGDLARADSLAPAATRAVYGDARIAAGDAAIGVLLRALGRGAGPVLDLACGRGTLLERLVAAAPRRPTIAGDVSPRVLRRTRARLGAHVPSADVAFVALDARATPFASGSIGAVVSYAGLANVGYGERLLAELARITGELIAVHDFIDPREPRNAEAVAALGIADLVYRDRAEGLFERNGWRLEVDVVRRLRASPTPASELIPGAGIDGIPVAPVDVEVAVLRATHR